MGIRIIVRLSECSGMACRLAFSDEQEAHDVVFCSHNAEILVDPKSLIWLEGTVVDFVQNSDESGFAFQNPDVKNPCGGGDGFYV